MSSRTRPLYVKLVVLDWLEVFMSALVFASVARMGRIVRVLRLLRLLRLSRMLKLSVLVDKFFEHLISESWS